MVADGSFCRRRLAAFPGILHKAPQSQAKSAIVSDSLQHQFAIFQPPRIDSDVLKTVRIIKELDPVP